MPGQTARGVARVARRLPPLRGRARVANVLHRWTGSSALGSFVIPMRRGHRMIVPMSCAQSWTAAFTGSYDDGELDLLARYITPESFVLDIGACLGFYTVPLGSIARDGDGHVVAIEPVAANCQILRANVEINDVTGVVSVLPVALGTAAGHAAMRIEPGGLGNATIVSGLDPAEIRRHDPRGRSAAEEVEVCTLDDLALPEPVHGRRCSLVKIDVEGFELDVLGGASRFIAGHRPVVFAEFHPLWLESRGIARAAPQEWASRNGYRCAEVVYGRANAFAERHLVSVRALPVGAVRSGSDLLLTPEEATR